MGLYRKESENEAIGGAMRVGYWKWNIVYWRGMEGTVRLVIDCWGYISWGIWGEHLGRKLKRRVASGNSWMGEDRGWERLKWEPKSLVHFSLDIGLFCTQPENAYGLWKYAGNWRRISCNLLPYILLTNNNLCTILIMIFMLYGTLINWLHSLSLSGKLNLQNWSLD